MGITNFIIVIFVNLWILRDEGWRLLEKIDESKLFIMSSEVALTNINLEKAVKRQKS